MTQPPIAVRRAYRLAAGNLLGPRPANAVLVKADPHPRIDRGALADRLSALSPGLGEAFLAVAVAGDGPAIADAFAGILAASTPCGRPLAVAVRHLPDAPAGRRLVLVEEGEVPSPPAEDVARLLCHLLEPALWPLPGEIAALLDRIARAIASSTWSALRRALAERRIPWRAGASERCIRVGSGAGRRDGRGLVAMTTGWIAATRTDDKLYCAALLRRAGLPVPHQRAVADAGAAAAAARELGFPVVVKPVASSGGSGVTTGLADERAVRQAHRRAIRVSPRVLVETMLPGADHRFLVIGGAVVSVVRKEPAALVGDGRRTLAELRAVADADPRRLGADAVLMPILCDDVTRMLLARQGLSWDDVPDAGRVVAMQSAANWDRGGTARDVGAIVHPDNLAAAVQAAAVAGLDIAGIDFLSPDIARSWRDAGGGICEVNRSPGAMIQLSARDLGGDPIARYVDHWLAGAAEIPVVAVVGDAAADRLATRLARGFARAGVPTGLATTGGVLAGDLPLRDPGPGRPSRITRLIDDPTLGAVVAVVSPEALRGRGFGHGHADLAILPGGSDAGDAAHAVLAGIGAAVVAAPDAAAEEPFVAAVVDRLLAAPRGVDLAPTGPLTAAIRRDQVQNLPGRRQE